VAAKVKSGTRSRSRLWAEFLADHERVPDKNRGLEGVLEGAQRGTFQVRNGAQWGSSPRPSSNASLRTADLYRVNFEVQQLKPFAVMLFRIWMAPKSP